MNILFKYCLIQNWLNTKKINASISEKFNDVIHLATSNYIFLDTDSKCLDAFFFSMSLTVEMNIQNILLIVTNLLLSYDCYVMLCYFLETKLVKKKKNHIKGSVIIAI